MPFQGVKVLDENPFREMPVVLNGCNLVTGHLNSDFEVNLSSNSNATCMDLFLVFSPFVMQVSVVMQVVCVSPAVKASNVADLGSLN